MVVVKLAFSIDLKGNFEKRSFLCSIFHDFLSDLLRKSRLSNSSIFLEEMYLG